MKAFASFLGSSRKRKVAVGPTPANDDRLSTVSSSMDQHILSAFPAPPSHDITTPSELAATIAHRFHNHPPETDIEYVASSNHLSMSQRSSESPSDSDASLSSFVRQKRSIPRMSVLNPERHGHHSRHEFESPRSPSTPPIVTSTPPTPHKSSAASDVTLLPSSASSIVSGKLPPVPGTPFASQARKTGTSGPRTSSRAAAGEPDFVLADPATNSSQLPISDLPHEVRGQYNLNCDPQFDSISTSCHVTFPNTPMLNRTWFCNIHHRRPKAERAIRRIPACHRLLSNRYVAPQTALFFPYLTPRTNILPGYLMIIFHVVSFSLGEFAKLVERW